MDAAMSSAITHLTAAVPALDADTAKAALEAAVPIPVRGAARFLEELTGHMDTHPDALTSGDSRCPPLLLRLTHVLHDAGHPVVRPGCAHCGKTVTNLRQLRPEGRICGTCDARSRSATCARCGRTDTRIAARRAEGGICHPCYRVDPQVVEECAQCGRLRNPVVRLPDGGALCIGCRTPPVHQCVSCGEMKPAALVDENSAFCHLCYNRHRRPRRLCGRCGRLARIACNTTGDQPDLCDSCYRGPDTTCSRCGRTRPCQRVSSGAPICHTCYAREERPRVTCCRCKRDLPVMAHWPIGPVCQSCYTAIVRSPAECARCRTSQPLIARDDDGAGVCGPCAGIDVDYTCHQCGRGGNPYGNGRCAYCVLADRVNKLLAGPDGAVSTQLQPLVEAFARVRLPFTAIRWVHASPNAKLLGQIVADGRPLSHDLLDELPPTAGVHYIRQIMVETGVLPRRNEDLERVPAWLDHHLADKRPEHANLVRPFLHWFLLRRARNRAAVRRHPASAGHDLRRRVLVALELLAWIDEQGMALQQLRQDDLDRWLDEEKTQRRHRIRYFLKWTADRGLTRSLAVAAIPRQQPADLLGDDERWQLLQRCLNNETMPIDVRAAGSLILLFGLQAQRIRHLCAEHVVAQDDNTYLTTGKHPILLPTRLGAIMGELADRPPTRLMIHHGPHAPRWLFPGRVPGQPIDNHSLTNRLNRHGISARPARNGALMALAADLPAAIIADLLGMHINTAIRWVRYAGRDWADYLAARAAEQDDT